MTIHTIILAGNPRRRMQRNGVNASRRSSPLGVTRVVDIVIRTLYHYVDFIRLT